MYVVSVLAQAELPLTGGDQNRRYGRILIVNHGFFDDTEQDDLSRQDARLARRCTPFYRAASLRAMCTLMVSATASAECWLVSTVRSFS